MKKNRVTILIILVLACLTFFASKFFQKEKGSKETITLEEYYHLDGERAKLFIDLEEVEENGYVVDDNAYIPLNQAKKMIKRLFYETENEIVIFTDAQIKYVYRLNSDEMTENGEERKLSFIPFIERDGEVFVSVDFIHEKYPLNFRVIKSPNRIVIFAKNDAYMEGIIQTDTRIRVAPDLDAKVVTTKKKNDTVWMVDDKENKEFSRVLSSDGVIGYIFKKHIGSFQNVDFAMERKDLNEGYKSIKTEEPIVLGWHQVFNKVANEGLEELLNHTEGLNVVSPTWFGIIREDGELSSLASKSYITKAHQRGIKVWGLVHDFDKKVDYYELFMKDENRTGLINNILYFVEEYSMDGINIDFENIKKEYAEGYVQFLRELSIVMRKKEKVLSVDNYVPAAHTNFYDREEQGIVADYVCVMAYDEHYFGSPEAGSVSSLSWVRRGIDETGKEVDQSKLIIGLPFYTRIWKIKSNGTMETKALGMEGGLKRVREGKANPVWDETTGQYVAEWKQGKDLYKIWLEEKRSMETKLSEVPKEQVAGIAFWKLGLEKTDVWDVIDKWLRE